MICCYPDSNSGVTLQKVLDFFDFLFILTIERRCSVMNDLYYFILRHGYNEDESFSICYRYFTGLPLSDYEFSIVKEWLAFYLLLTL